MVVFGIRPFFNGLYLEFVGSYPKEARKKGIEGQVFVSFIVYKNGIISDPEIIKGSGHGCDEVALQSFKELGLNWISGKKDGVNVKVKMVMLFTFKLNNGE